MSQSAVSHWKIQRYSAVALIPLTLWFVFSVVSLGQADYVTTASWVNSTSTQFFLGLFIAISAIHASFGIEVVIEDYVRQPKRQPTIILAKSVIYIAAVLSILAIFQINIEVPQL